MKIHYFIEEKRDQKRHQNLIKVKKKLRNTIAQNQRKINLHTTN